MVDAIESLREALTRAVDGGGQHRMRFRLAPIELTLQVVLTKDVHGKVGWKVLEVGGTRESVTTQTLKVQLDPVWEAPGGVLVEDPLISGVFPEQS